MIRHEPDCAEIAAELEAGIGVVVRRLRQIQGVGDLTLAESASLARLDRGGAATSAELARKEHVTPQSMGAILATLEGRGLVERQRDPHDARRVLVSATEDGSRAMRERRGARTERLAHALADFSPAERDELASAARLLERLARGL